MKIAIVTLQYKETATGGGGVHVQKICEQFVNMGLDVTILSIHTNKTLPGSDLKEWKVPYSISDQDGLKVARFLIDKNIEQPYDGNKNTELERIKRFADTVLDWLKERPKEFDVIKLHGHHIIPGYMARELKGSDASIISYLHALETTYVTGKGDFVGAFDGTTEVLEKIRKWEAMCCYADHIIVNSPIVRDEIKGIIKECEEDAEKYYDKIMLLASGCNGDFLMQEEEINSKLKEIPEVIDLVTFCRVDPSKGVEYSIKGACKAAEGSSYRFCLTIAGIPASPEYIDLLKKETLNLPDNLEVKFNLLDAISSTEEKKYILDNKHIYILPTLKEPFGMSLIEASARGNMIVSADTNGPRYMFESDKGERTEWGIVTPRGVLAAITEDHHKNFSQNVGRAIVWVVDNWSGSRDRVKNFNKKIKEVWTWEGIGKQYLELFKSGKMVNSS
ncbi:MAG: glycosyltransferase family 4 protein [Candidatus Omnitrophota bacterium]